MLDPLNTLLNDSGPILDKFDLPNFLFNICPTLLKKQFWTMLDPFEWPFAHTTDASGSRRKNGTNWHYLQNRDSLWVYEILRHKQHVDYGKTLHLDI